MKRLLTIGHSYVVAANRRLAHEMAVQGRGEWEVTAIAPARYRGDLRPIDVEPIDGEARRAGHGASPPRSHPASDVVRRIGARRAGARLGRRPLLGRALHPDGVAASPGAIGRARQAGRRQLSEHLEDLSVAAAPFRAAKRCSRAAGWIAFGESVRSALARAPVLSRTAVPRHSTRRRPAAVSSGSRRRRRDPRASRLAGRRRRRRLSRAVRASRKGLEVLIDALDGCRGPWRRAVRRRRSDSEAVLRRFADRVIRAASTCRPASRTTRCRRG